MKAFTRAMASSISSARARTSTRLHVDRYRASLTAGALRISSRGRTPSPQENESFSRISSGAVLWFMPTRMTFMLTVNFPSGSPALRKLMHRAHEIHTDECRNQHHQCDDGQHGDLLPLPADGEPLMQQKRIKTPGRKGPDRFRVRRP